MSFLIGLMLFLVTGIFCSVFLFPYISRKYTYYKAYRVCKKLADKYIDDDYDTYEKLTEASQMSYKAFKETSLWDIEED